MIKEMIASVVIGLSAMGMIQDDNGYEEVVVPEGEEYTHIVCEVVSNESQGYYEDEYLPCVNVYDRTDVPILDKEDVNEGDLVHVIFEHDDVYSVDKIEGYKMMIKKEDAE
ncbi:hypothetical protein [Sporosarcina sp. FSL W7-1283]|uniref:hypothetical protein n=1 Tax=Sporosarcina sp. FSL W7-1283 TaxID=2921560 RepID=UPI0030F58FB1